MGTILSIGSSWVSHPPMHLHDPGHGLRRVNTADFLSLIALALFGTDWVTVLNTILPLAFLQPAWLVTLISALLGSAPLALLGLVNIRWPIWSQTTSGSRAVAAVIGVLLLLPLQAASAFQGLGLQLTEQRQSLPELKSMLSERLQESIRSSRDVVHSPWPSQPAASAKPAI